MTYLGDANPLHRIGRTIWGWFAPLPPARLVPEDFYIIGHRGAARVAPENTIAAFAQAIELGANAIETDVCITQDGYFILWHDADPDDALALMRQMGGEGFPYVPNVPALGSPWRQPISALELSVVRTHYGYVRRERVLVEREHGDTRPEVSPTVFGSLIDWLRRERRVRHVFLDLKLAPTQVEAATGLLGRLHRLCTRDGFRNDLAFHLLSPQVEIVKALMGQAQHMGLPPTLRLYADFELPGVCRCTPRLGVRHVSMGCRVRTWVDFRHEVAQVIAARDNGRFDTVVAWTVNNETRLKELMALGINGIITDDPALLYRLVVEHRRRTSGRVAQTQHR